MRRRGNIMKKNQPKLAFYSALLLTGLSCSSVTLANSNEHHTFLTKMATQKANAMGATLKAALKPAMKKGGPAKSIAVCNHIAPATQQSMTSGAWSVARTSEKWRNPDNKPDAWELQQLQYFAEQLTSGVSANQLISTDIVTIDGKQAFRFMRPIMAKGMCLQCHGKSLSADVQQSLNTLYPEDNATGYSAGELRGAFTILKWLTPNDLNLLGNSSTN